MGMAKKATAPVAEQEAPKAAAPIVTPPAAVESGAAAAVKRLNDAVKSEVAKTAAPLAGNALNERILRQGVYQHVAISAAVAGMKFKMNDEGTEYVELVAKIAEKLIAKILQK